MNVTPARTRTTRWGAFTTRKRSRADSASLNAMASPAAPEQRSQALHPLHETGPGQRNTSAVLAAGHAPVPEPPAGPGMPARKRRTSWLAAWATSVMYVFGPAGGRRARPVQQLPRHPVENCGGQQRPDSGEQCAPRHALGRGGGAPQDQRPDPARVVQGQLKGNGSAQRHAIHVGGRGAGRVEDSQRVFCHQLHGVGPGRVGAATHSPVIEPDDTVRRSQLGDGAMPHASPVSVAHDKQDRVARSAVVPPDPGVGAAGERHGFPFTLVATTID